MSTKPRELQDGRDSHLPAGAAHLGWGNLVEAGEQSPVFTGRALPHCLPFLEMGEHGPLSVCCSWKRFNRCCPRPQGTRGFCTDRQCLRGRGCRASRNRWATILAGNFGDVAGGSPQVSPKHSFCLFIQMFVHGTHYPWTQNIRQLPTANRILTARLSFPVLSNLALPQLPNHVSLLKSHSHSR